MEKVKKLLNHIFIDGLSGMALGLFATLIVGTIIKQLGALIGGEIGNTLTTLGTVASVLTGAGIGCGVAYKFKESPLVVLSAAYIGIEVGHLVSGKTKIDILVTPLCSILTGSAVGLIVGPPISAFMEGLGDLIEIGTRQQPFIMGIIVSVLMGMFLTLPISSAAIGLVLGLSGLPAGAATVGCCANMVGFAVASYRENKVGGLLAQGVGTSMLQVPNIVKKPVIWLPAIITSAILGPLSTMVFKMTNNAAGSGMGTAGFVGQIMTYQTMVGAESASVVLIKIALMHFILPAILTLLISEFMRKKGYIKFGDMKLDV